MRSYSQHVEDHLIPHLGTVRLDELTGRRVAAMFATMAATPNHRGGLPAASTLHRIRATLRSALNAAIREGLIVHNPARDIELPARRDQHARVWTSNRVAEWRCPCRKCHPCWSEAPTTPGLPIGQRRETITIVLLRLAYLAVTNTLAAIRLLPMTDRRKDVEILLLRHEIGILQRQLGEQRPRFQPDDRAFLAALLHRLPMRTLRELRLLVRPDTILRWHRDLIAGRHTIRSRPSRRGRPRSIRSIRLLVLRLAKENPTWGYRRIHGELLTLGVKVAPSTVWQMLKEASIDPAPLRAHTTWASFLRSQAQGLLACDFFETTTLTGTKLFVLAVIEHATRRIRIRGATPHPTAAWVTQVARNLVMDLQDAGANVKYLIRDRDGKYPAMFDTVLTDHGMTVLLSERIPRAPRRQARARLDTGDFFSSGRIDGTGATCDVLPRA